MKFTKIPIVIYYGDNIPDKPSANPGQEQWRIFFEVAKKWRDAVKKRGGDVTLVHLPQIGIRGNTHFPMSDLNNVEIADLTSKGERFGLIDLFLENGSTLLLDGCKVPETSIKEFHWNGGSYVRRRSQIASATSHSTQVSFDLWK